MPPMHGLSKEFIVQANFQIRDSIRECNDAKESLEKLRTSNSCKKHNLIIQKKIKQFEDLERQCNATEMQINHVIEDNNVADPIRDSEQGKSNELENSLKVLKKTKERKYELITLNMHADTILGIQKSKGNNRINEENLASYYLVKYLNKNKINTNEKEHKYTGISQINNLISQCEDDRNQRIVELTDLLKFQNNQRDKVIGCIKKLSSQIEQLNNESLSNSYHKWKSNLLEFEYIKDRDKIKQKTANLYKDILIINTKILNKQNEYKDIKAKAEIERLIESDFDYEAILFQEIENLEQKRNDLKKYKPNLQDQIASLDEKIEDLKLKFQQLQDQINEIKSQYQSMQIKQRFEFSIKEEVKDVMTHRKVLKKILIDDDTFESERQSLTERLRNSLAHKENNNVVFSPTDEELEGLVPEGNKVEIKKIDNDEWIFGTKRFTFTKDIKGNVYARTREGEVLFDDFVAIFEETEQQKSMKEYLQKSINDGEHEEFDEADFAEVGEEYERIEESDSCIASKIRHF